MSLTRQQIAERLNGNNLLSSNFTGMKQQILEHIVNHLAYTVNKFQTPQPEDDPNSPEAKYREAALILNAVGPAAASSAMEYTIARLKTLNQLKNPSAFGTDYVENLKLLRNEGFSDPRAGISNATDTLRQFLLPRYAYLDFDIIVDPRHMVDKECGYPKFITPIMYRYMYDRDDVAARVVDLYADEIWAAEPCIYDYPDDVETPFEARLKYYITQRHLLQFMYRMDKLCGVGHYGALLYGIDDGKELDQPVDGIDPMGNRMPGFKKEYNLLYLRPFDEYLSFVQQYETNVNSPRYGLPVMYNLVFLDMTIDAAGASIGTRLNRRVHWTRVQHIADNLHSSLVFGVPRQQRVFNKLLNLRKLYGADAEGLWKAGFPGIAFEVDPSIVADEPDFDKEEFKKEVDEFSNRLAKYITLIGIKAHTLDTQLADPKPHVEIQLQAIASYMNAPLRLFLGSEHSDRGGAAERTMWNKRLGRKIRMFTDPYLVRQIIDRLLAYGMLPPPKNNQYCVEWGDLNVSTDEDKANLSLKWTQALSQYVASGAIHLIPPQEYLTVIMGLKPAEALRIIAKVEKLGGWAMLLKVDPSQATNNEQGKTGKNSQGRQSSDKSSEGLTS
jgi:hypothetical protein